MRDRLKGITHLNGEHDKVAQKIIFVKSRWTEVPGTPRVV
jgi:hypothetical protein